MNETEEIEIEGKRKATEKKLEQLEIERISDIKELEEIKIKLERINKIEKIQTEIEKIEKNRKTKNKTCSVRTRRPKQEHKKRSNNKTAIFVKEILVSYVCQFLKQNGWVLINELSGCGFESCFCHLNFRYGTCFKQGVPWPSGKL